MSALYYEPGTKGHRAAFLSAILLCGSDDWIVASPIGLITQLSDAARSRLAPHGPIRHIELHTEYSADFSSVKNQWLHSQKVAEELNCANVFHPMIDMFLNFGPLLQHGSIANSGIYFRPMQHYTNLSARDQLAAVAKNFLGTRFLSRRDAGVLFSLDRFFPSWASRNWKNGDRVYFLPDLNPVSEDFRPSEKRYVYRLHDGRIKFLLFGALQRRKGLFDVLDAIEIMDDSLLSQCEFRFCGSVAADARDFPNRLFQVANTCAAEFSLDNRFLSDSELVAEVAASDIILAPYHWQKGSSGVLYWAAALGKPVIGQDFGLVGLEIRNFSLGVPVKPGDIEALADALSEAVRQGGLKVNLLEQQRFLDGHHAADFATTIERGLGPVDIRDSHCA